MLKRFFRAFLTFVGIIVPGTFVLALLMAPPARPEPVQPPVATAILPMQPRALRPYRRGSKNWV